MPGGRELNQFAVTRGHEAGLKGFLPRDLRSASLSICSMAGEPVLAEEILDMLGLLSYMKDQDARPAS